MKIYLSKVSDAFKCPRYYFLRYKKQVVEKEKPDYFTFGEHFHQVLKNVFTSQPFEHNLDLGYDKIEDIKEMVGVLLEELQPRIKEVLFVEQLFILKGLQGLWEWYTKPDLVFKDIHGKVWICDYKTTGGSPISTARYYYLSPQTRTYGYVFRTLHPELEVAGTLIAAISKPRARTAPKVHLEEIHWSSFEEEKAKMFIRYASEHILKLEEEMEFPMYPTQCVNYFGAKECPYVPVCYNRKVKWPKLDEQLLKDWYRTEDPEEHLWR